MTLGNGSRGQLHRYVRAHAYICAYTICFKISCHQAILHHIGASRAYTLHAKHVTFGVCGSILIT